MRAKDCAVLLCSISLVSALQAQNEPRLDDAAVERFARLALDCVQREYPNKIAHVMNSDRDALPPRELTPAFQGCFDWHSAVHGHWLLARLCRMYPDAPFVAEARAALTESFTPEKVAKEVEYLAGEGRKSFERPYGLAWLLQLCAELREWDDPQARLWAATLEPLEQIAADRFREWLPKLSHPVRTGEHSQTAFALGLAHDWAVTRDDYQLRALVEERARAFYLSDQNANPAFEPGGEDFLSPILAEADLMRRILPPPALAAWLTRLLPDFDGEACMRWLTPAVVTDKTDGKLVHLDGLNLSRAWMLEGITDGLPADDPRLPRLHAAAEAHRRAGLEAVNEQRYEGGHWLGSFATYLVTERYVSLPERHTWQPLFDGKLLEGWLQRGGQARYYVENGVIVGSSVFDTPNSFLCTERQFGDFDLELEYKVDPRMNSGIQIRSNSFPDYQEGRVHGYQVEIDPSERAWSAGIYDESRRGWLNSLEKNEPARRAFRPNEWNRCRILAVGDWIQTWLNGVPAADLIDSMTQTGFIALQVHNTKETEPLTVRWRAIQIRELGQHVWEALYDGESLAAWRTSDANTWQIRDGLLVGAMPTAPTSPVESPSAGQLYTANMYTDLTVRLKYKSLVGSASLRFRGLRIMLGENRLGTIFLEDREQPLAEPPADIAKWHTAGEWTKMTLSVHGSRLALHLNDQRVADVADVPLTSPESLGIELESGAKMQVEAIERLAPATDAERKQQSSFDDAVGIRRPAEPWESPNR